MHILCINLLSHSAGRGGLVQDGAFWYPVRLIERLSSGLWRVRWWRGNQYESESLLGMESTTLAEENKIIDSLWSNVRGRRETRVSVYILYARRQLTSDIFKLGKWVHSFNIPSAEDILADPTSIAYQDEVNQALEPAKKLLVQLLLDSESMNPSLLDTPIPALKHLHAIEKNARQEQLPYIGNLTVNERAQIANWFEVHVSRDPSLRHHWVGYLPLAHAITIFIAHRLHQNPPRDLEEEVLDGDLLPRAWEIQVQNMGSLNDDVDVDKQCLERLEEEMFENSSRAGMAGNHQWGLDAGDHQEGWNPYLGTPEHWNHGDRPENDDTEMRVSSFLTFVGLSSYFHNNSERVRIHYSTLSLDTGILCRYYCNPNPNSLSRCPNFFDSML